MTYKLFTAEWCESCTGAEALADDRENVQVVDVNENTELANKYTVRSLPTLVEVDDDGTPRDNWIGSSQVVRELRSTPSGQARPDDPQRESGRTS
jgi:thiol-disulfide isomerase/thioredoxin